jgi:NADP-dependent aldehyde dehydrogenase
MAGPAVVDRAAEAAAGAARAFGESSAASRAELLEGIAAGLEAERAALVATAMAETNLPEARLQGEIDRTAYQLRAFARLVRSGRHVRAIVEHPDPDYPLGEAPDLRLMLHPVGPVAVFAASNFPFAFSVAGGDTAAALAAGCPVVLKAHPAHPELSRATAAIVHRAAAEAGAPEGVFALIEGQSEGVALVEHPAMRAAAFTGSLQGGRALFDIAARRASPIPFYGELGSVNPVFVTAEAARDRVDEIARGFVGSLALGTGQFCTKPGIVFAPAGTGFADRAAAAIDAVAPGRMLSERILEGYLERGDVFSGVAGVEVVRPGTESDGAVTPALFRTDAATFLAHSERLSEERFGPSGLVVEYDDETQLAPLASGIAASLTWTVHATAPGDGGLDTILAEGRERSGRIIFNGWPTGVTVSPAMMHGGPYPATTASLHTSVGTTAIGRFLRPVSYQGFPDELLPPELAEANPLAVPRETDLSRESR